MTHSDPEPVLLTAAHGFYQFAIARNAFDRSLYYNLLLQPAIAIPDHYFLQGSWMGEHLDAYPGRDSWLETGLRNKFVVPYFRQESSTLSSLLTHMEGSDRRGFGNRARAIAERLDRTPYKVTHWSSATNSATFGKAFAHYLSADVPPMLENLVDPDDFVGFWRRSRKWIDKELAVASDRSSNLLGSEGILLSQLIQVSGERLLGADCGRIESVDELLARVKARVGAVAERDLRAFYACACEIYNRSLADTMLTTPNSPEWKHFVAAMDLWGNELTARGAVRDLSAEEPKPDFAEVIRLPRPIHLRTVSGDALLAIRRSQACERYFESLGHWRTAPHDGARQGELVEALHRYSEEIRGQVGKDVGFLGLKPKFISKSSDVSRALEKGPGVVQGFLAVGATTGAATGMLPPLASAGLFSLFCLQLWAKYHSPSKRVRIELSPRHAVRVHPDVTVSRA